MKGDSDAGLVVRLHVPAMLCLFGTLTVATQPHSTGHRLHAGPSYLITAPRHIRPDQVVQVRAHVFRLDYAILAVRTSIRKDGAELASASETFTSPSARMLQMWVPDYADPGSYTLHVQGSADHGINDVIFQNETKLLFSPKQISIFIQTDKTIYQKRSTGVYEGEIPTNHPTKHGWWTIEVESLGQMYRKQFKTENFFFTRFDINISMPSILSENEHSLAGVITANDTHSGVPSRASGSIQLEIRPPGWAGDYPTIEKPLPMIHGTTGFMFTLQEMREFAPILAGAELVVSATLEHWYGLETKTSTAHVWVYSYAPHIKFLGGRIRTFKPGQPIHVYIAVYQRDGSAHVHHGRRQIVIHSSVRERGGKVRTLPQELKLIPDTSIVHYTHTPQADDEMVIIRAAYAGQGNHFVELSAYRHYTESNQYVHVTTSTKDPEVDTYIVFTVKTTTYIPEIYYQILSGGNIVLADTLFMNTRQKTFDLAVSRDMVPNARIVVYAIHSGGEILSDSLSYHVKGIRSNGVRVGINKGKDFSGDTVELVASTDPGTFVSFGAAKYEFYRLGAHSFITEHDVEEDLLEYDKPANQSFRHTWLLDDSRKESVHFNAPDMAVDPNTTFSYAGLLVFTDAQLTRITASQSCNFSLGYLPCFGGSCFHVDQQCDQHWNCEDGADEMGCDGDPTVAPIYRPDVLSKLERMNSHMDDTSWAWRSLYSKPDGRVYLKVSSPLRPLPWVISALSLSQDRGLAFSEIPTRFDPTRAFFIVMESPKSAFRGEQIGMQVAVHNYWHQPLEAILTLDSSSKYRFVAVESNGRISSYDPRTITGDIQTMVYLLPGESRYVHFPILPTVLGKVKVSVQAYSFIRSQTASKSITISMNGVTNTYHTPMLIDLVNKGASIIPDLWIPVPERFLYPGRREHLYVPGSQKARLMISGDVVGPGLFASTLDAYNVLGQVDGLADQGNFDFGVNLYTLQYLKAMNQLPDATMERVLKGMSKQLQNIYNYVQKDGGVAQHKKMKPSSVWLTSLTLELLARARDDEWEHVMHIDEDVLNKMANWLLDQQNTTTGAFRQTAGFLDLKLRSDMTTVDGLAMNTTVTARAVVGLVTAVPVLNGKTQARADTAKSLAADYLAEHFDQLEDPYEVCLVTYALRLANHKAASMAFKKMRSIQMESEYVYWSPKPVPPNPTEIVNTVPMQHPSELPLPHESKAVEATSYALMVYLMNNWYMESAPIMKWLQTRRLSHSGFDGYRDSLAAIQALSAYATRDTNKHLYNILLNIESTADADWKKNVHLKKGNFIRYEQQSVAEVWGAVKSHALGTGLALFQMTTEVNVEYPWQMRRPPVEAFSLELDPLRFSGRNSSIMEMNVCVRWLATHIAPTSGSAIVEVDIPTGFFVRKSVLKENQRVGRIDSHRSRFTKQKVVLYTDFIDDEKSCWYFRAERWYPVANGTIQHKIRVYDTSEPALQNTTMYTTYGLYHNHICQVCGSFQCPYCPFYNGAPGIVLQQIHLVVALAIATIIVTTDRFPWQPRTTTIVRP